MPVDMDDEVRRFKWMLIVLIVFLITGWHSWDEMVFAFRGHQATGQIIGISRKETVGSRGRTWHWQAVSYTFNDEAGSFWSGEALMPLDWQAPADGSVGVRYLADGRARIEGQENLIALMVFLGLAAWLGWLAFGLWKEAREAVSGPPRRRRR